MTPGTFIAKWRASELKERSAAQEHFIDLCRLLGEPTPAEADPTGERYCFERGARKDGGGDGWADVWKRHCFAWEYNGKHADLDAAFSQLRQYALALENPQLLIVSDMARFRIRTNWTNSVSATHEFALEIPSRVWLAIGAKARKPKIDYPALRVVRSGEKALSLGEEVYSVEGVSVPIFNRAKIMVDCFRFKRHVGFDVAVEGRHNVIRSEQAKLRETVQLARSSRK